MILNFNAKKIPVIRLDEAESTQKTAREWLAAGRIREETVITARYQRAGQGRGGNSWTSEKGKNLLLTQVLFPDFLRPEQQFSLSVALSLAVADVVSRYVPGVTIKWPNDIYVGRKKIAGILIENDIRGNRIISALAGIGVNVNQTAFPPSLPNPVSLKMITGKTHDPEELLEQFLLLFGGRYYALKAGKGQEQREEYTGKLYLYDKEASFGTSGGEVQARITGIDRYGRLLLTDGKGIIRAYGMEGFEYKV